MCVTYCHRKRVLYWNHEDCADWGCELAEGPHESCETCRHWRGRVCWLTNAPLPDSGGCCHHDVGAAQGLQVVTREMLEPLGIGPGETLADVLARWDAPYEQLDRRGEAVVVDPDMLGIPVVYGAGTESEGEEIFPWPESEQ
jgi:hypothetical protein